RVLAELLSRMLVLAVDDEAKLAILRELAPLSKELGDHAAARAHFDAITRLDPADRDATEALEHDASERADHEAVALLLAPRVASSTSGEARKAVRLRRAAVLEQRLGRLDEACAELEALLEELPNDVSGMRYLADLCERQNATMRAATLWDRLREMA